MEESNRTFPIYAATSSHLQKNSYHLATFNHCLEWGNNRRSEVREEQIEKANPEAAKMSLEQGTTESKRTQLEEDQDSGQLVELKKAADQTTRFVFDEKNEKLEVSGRFYGKDSTEYAGLVKKVKQTGQQVLATNDFETAKYAFLSFDAEKQCFFLHPAQRHLVFSKDKSFNPLSKGASRPVFKQKVANTASGQMPKKKNQPRNLFKQMITKLNNRVKEEEKKKGPGRRPTKGEASGPGKKRAPTGDDEEDDDDCTEDDGNAEFLEQDGQGQINDDSDQEDVFAMDASQSSKGSNSEEDLDEEQVDERGIVKDHQEKPGQNLTKAQPLKTKKKETKDEYDSDEILGGQSDDGDSDDDFPDSDSELGKRGPPSDGSMDQGPTKRKRIN